MQRPLHWESWLLRAVLLATVGWQLVNGNREGTLVALEGFVLSLLPALAQRSSRAHVPRLLELAYVFGMTLQFVSESLKLFELFTYWDKLVHPTLIGLGTMLCVWFALGYSDLTPRRLSVRLAAVFGLLVGMGLGTVWEFVELGFDWFGRANLQKSNADTLTDILANNIGALLAMVWGTWAYAKVLGANQRREIGEIGQWLAHFFAAASHRAGLVGATAVLGFAAVLVLAQVVEGGVAGATLATTGAWQETERGTCYVDPPDTRPGTEQPGVFILPERPATSAYTLSSRVLQDRPPLGQGTQMSGGVAFGVRSTSDLYVLQLGALHDVLRLERYVHGRRRDVREEMVRVRGDESHVLGVRVAGETAVALLDGREVFAVDGLEVGEGGIGLWARSAATTCFSEVDVLIEPSTPPSAGATGGFGWIPQAAAIAALTGALGLLLFGYRDRNQLGVSYAFIGTLVALAGLGLGMLWELVEFVIDWVGFADLQPSNLDTLTDLLACGAAASLAAPLALAVYKRAMRSTGREWLGARSQRLTDATSSVLERHGGLVTAVTVAVLALVLASLWFTERAAPRVSMG